MRAICLALIVFTFGCDRFEKPSPDQCEVAVKNLMRHAVGARLDEKYPSKKPGVEGVLENVAKSIGKDLITEYAVDKPKLAWCEVNMSRHQTDCLRAGQTKEEVMGCGIKVDENRNLVKAGAFEWL